MMTRFRIQVPNESRFTNMGHGKVGTFVQAKSKARRQLKPFFGLELLARSHRLAGRAHG